MATNNATNNYYTKENSIIGGNFDTNPWQRNTNFATVPSTTYTADRFLWVQNGTGVVNIAKTADAPTVAQAGIFTENCLGVTVNTADVAIAAADFYSIQYRMEGYDWAQLAQDYFTFSFFVKSSLTGIYCISFRNTGGDRSFIKEYTISAANTWQFITFNVLPSPTAGTWNYTNALGILIDFNLAVGSTRFTTANSWQTGNFNSTSNQVNFMATVNNVFEIQLIDMYKGLTTLPWTVRSEAEELALCQRYYFKTFNQGTNVAQNSGTTVGAHSYIVTNGLGTNGGNSINFPVSMRTTPTMTAYNPLAANTNWRSITDGSDSGTSSFSLVGARGSQVANTQVLADGAGDLVAIHLTASAEL